MNEILQFMLLLVLTSSVILQSVVAFFAIRLLRLSRYHFSWIMFCAALVLMVIRRAVAFFQLLSSGISYPSVLWAETIAMLISLLMAAGLFAVVPLLRRIYLKSDSSDGSSLGELFEKVNSGVAVYEAVDKGRDFVILNINPAAERIEKTARQYVVGRRLTEAFPGSADFGLPAMMLRVWKTGQPERLSMRYYQDDRISGWRDIFVYRRAGGEVVTVYNDVSAQMHLQEELERCGHKIRMLFEQTPLPYQALDGEGRILEVNPAWLRLTGLKPEAAVGRPFSELLTREGRQSLQECLAGLKHGETVSDVTMDLRRNDGAIQQIKMDARSLRGKTGGIEQIYCMLCASGTSPEPDSNAEIEKQARRQALDLLIRERRELQRQRFDLLGELTAGIAHELSAPLAAARNAFNLMREDIAPTSRHYEFAGLASRELARIADLIERMYCFHEESSHECEPININAFLDNTLILVRPMMKERRIQLRDERTEGLPPVLLPPGAVMRVLINPIKNSIEAMPPDGLLTLRTGTSAQGGVFVEIEDNGPGIPKDFLPHLFEPFTTFRQTGGGQGGMGLGMAIVRRTLDVLGGSVTVHSNMGEGTCVQVVLPATMPDRKDVA